MRQILLISLIGLTCGIGGIYLGRSLVKGNFDKNCNIPNDYCDPSIKSLEEELKIAFKKSDDCSELSGSNKKQLMRRLNRCDKIRKKSREFLIECNDSIKLWSLRAEQVRMLLLECNSKLGNPHIHGSPP